MEKQVIFVKKFTGISSLQSAHKLTYFILRSEHGCPYGVGIECTHDDEGAFSDGLATHIIKDRQQADDIALFLYENSIYPEQLQDLIHDFKVSGILENSATPTSDAVRDA